MESWLKEIQDFQKAQENNINDFVRTPIEDMLKARAGIYANTPENRKLGRVGQKYGHKKADLEAGKFMSSAKTTEELHSKDGKWSKSRSVLHKKIVESHMKGVESSNKPVAILIMGGSASGKGSASKALVKELVKKHIGDRTIPTLDVDEIKKEIPEYKNFAPIDGANNVHKESSKLGKEIRSRYIDNKVDFINDGTFGDPKKAAEMVAKLKKQGYKVHLVNVTTSIEESKKREKGRFERTGRKVKEKILEQAHIGGVESYETLKNQVDSHFMLDNNVPFGSPPKMLDDNGKVSDKQAYRDFLNKNPKYKRI